MDSPQVQLNGTPSYLSNAHSPDRVKQRLFRQKNDVRDLDEDNIKQLLHLSDGSVSRALTVLNYGGAELIQTFNDIIAPNSTTERKTVHKLCESLAARDQDVSYNFFVEHMISHVMNLAKQAANSAQMQKASQLAELSNQLTNHKIESDTYNLDRKQTLLTLFSMIQAAQ